MSTSFFITLIVAAIVVAHWRLLALAAATLVLAALVTGIGAVSAVITDREAPTVIAPAQSGPPDLSGEAIPKAAQPR
jgi:hypothetical protein